MTGIDLTTRVREVPDFPEPGVGFKDISPLLLDPEALRQAVGRLADWTRERGADLVLGAEARGFWLGAAIAVEAGCGFVAARRPGKLPPETVSATYALEYGKNTLEVAADAIGGRRARRHPRRRARNRRHRGGDRRSRRSSSAAPSSASTS